MLSPLSIRLVHIREPILNSRAFHQSAVRYGPLSSLRQYVLRKYTIYVQNYELLLEKRFPSAFHMYRVFKIGITDFYGDLKSFVTVMRNLTTKKETLSSLSRRDLELYHKMPKDMLKIAPVLLISALPFANYVIFPLAYYFPKHLLTSHFWSLQQRTRFAVDEQTSRLRYNKPVLRGLQAQMSGLKTHPLFTDWRQCVALLGSGMHPSTDQIRKVAPLFSDSPYSLDCLTPQHVHALLRIHHLHVGWRRRARLYEHGKYIHLIDKAIIDEGGVATLTNDEIRSACFLRGLNPTSMNSEDTVIWLSQWVNLTSSFTEDEVSLILHLPILTAYNHPSNWVLIY